MEFPPGEMAPDAASPAPVADELAVVSATVEPVGTRGAAVSRARPSTGDARVDDAVARLDDLPGLPLAEHLAVLEYVHERLTEALGDLDVHAPARSGDQPSGLGASGG
jgi:hypothetical protein